MKMSNYFEPVAKEARTNESFLVAAIGNVRGVLAQCFARDETQAKAAIEALTMDSMGGTFKVEVIDREAAPGLWLEGSAEYIKGVLRDRKVSKFKDPNESLLSEYGKYAEHIAEGDPMAFDDWLAGSDLPEIVKARELSKLLERKVSNFTNPANMNPPWSNEHCEAAQREGWDIFDTHGSDGGPWQLQRFDDASEVPGAPQLKDDETAWRIVIQGTAAHHEAARQFIRTHSPKEWAALNQREVSNYIEHPASGQPQEHFLNTDPSVIEAKVMKDYAHFLGKDVLVSRISGFVGDDSTDIELSPPAKVRVETTSEQSLKRWIDGWCDPVYEVVLVEDHPQLACVRSLWIHGPSLHLNGKQTEVSDIVSIAEPIAPRHDDTPSP